MSSGDVHSLAASDLLNNHIFNNRRHEGSSDQLLNQTEFPTNAHIFLEADFNTEQLHLGSGGYGTVIRRVLRSHVRPFTVMCVAEKRFLNTPSLESDKQLREAIKKEANVLASIQHDHVVKLLGIKIGHHNFSLIMEYMQNGSCHDFFRKLPSRIQNTDKWPLKYQMSVQVANAMKFLHSSNFPLDAEAPKHILHLDLKSRNVLVDHKLNAKLCDFGLAQLKTMSRMTQEAATASQRRDGKSPGGTITHIAPEHLTGNVPPSSKSDVYSYGIFLWEIMAEREPYEHAISNEVLKLQIAGGNRPDDSLLDINTPLVMKECMVKAWHQDKTKRPEFEKLYSILTQHIPFPFSPEETHRAVQTIRRHLGCDNVTHSDSQLISRAERCSFPKETTRSDGDTRVRQQAHHRAFQHTTSNETRPKLPIRPNPVGNDPNVERDTCRPSSSAESTAPWVESDDNVPLTADESSASSVSVVLKTTRSKWFKICVIGSVFLVVVAATLISLCTTGVIQCFIRESCAPRNPKKHQSINCVGNFSERVPPGTLCIIKCDEGYGVIDGHIKLKCLQNGTWSRSLPQCLKLGICPKLRNPANGGSISCTNKNYETSICTFSCPPGSKLHPPDQKPATRNESFRKSADFSSTTCGPSGSTFFWSNLVPYCESAIPCNSLPQTIGGALNCTRPLLDIEDDSYTNGTRCTMVCNDPHFGVRGGDVVSCSREGKWNATSVVCEMQCPVIESSPPINFSCIHDRFVQSVCTFNCPKNFIMLGNLRTSCQPDGSWTHPPSKCICPACLTGSKCDQPNTWDDLVKKLNISLEQEKNFFYGDYEISCKGEEKYYNLKSKPTVGFNKTSISIEMLPEQHSPSTWFCQCKDVHSNRIKQCNGDKDRFTACKNTLATLIFTLAFDGIYPVPCDAQKMPLPCV
ncbi:unnamed protein product [Clavelina lepadiformis]|uniref:Uncharacterized protein n=1 Tax=Clavelina lepadiformis TaxID=159417 RepID=A0ABP0FCX1_CLALP